jgi:hypothetical protein
MKKPWEKKEIIIENKIFTKNDIVSLIGLFSKLCSEILYKSKEMKHRDLIREGWTDLNIAEKHTDTSHSNIEFTSSDNLKYNLTFEEMAEVKAIIDSNRIVEIELYFRETVLNSEFIIKIRYSDSHSGSSYAMVEGQDSNWVNDSIKSVEDFLSNCKNQSTHIKKFKFLIIGLTILILNYFLFNLIELFIRIKLAFSRIIDSIFNQNLFMVFIVLTAITLTPAFFTYNWLEKLFPEVEIRTGKDFERIVTEKRKKVGLIILLIIIPAILSYLLRHL